MVGQREGTFRWGEIHLGSGTGSNSKNTTGPEREDEEKVGGGGRRDLKTGNMNS